jgi:hypothetical protein
MKIGRVLLGALLACGCGEGSDGAGAEADASTDAAPMGAPECVGTVVLGRYRTADCTPGEEVGTVTIHLARPCDAWTRSSMRGTKTDSFTRLQCYRDRVCFTVHPDSATCAPGASDADVELRAGVCQRDKPLPDGTLLDNFTKVISGLDDCPEAPAGFACPMSDGGDGTQGVQAACAAP